MTRLLDGVPTSSHLVVGLMLLAAFPAHALGQEVSMRGLGAVRVEFSLAFPSEDQPVDTNRIRTAIELELRRNGVPVSTTDDGATPILLVEGVFLRNKTVSGYVNGSTYSLVGILGEKATVARLGTVPVLVSTWGSSVLLRTLGTELPEPNIVSAATEIVDEFANAYLTANPRSP